MIIVMRRGAGRGDIREVRKRVRAVKLKPVVSHGTEITTIGVVGEITPRKADFISALVALDSVEKVNLVSTRYKLSSRDFHPENSVIQVGDIEIGGQEVIIIAGPCAVESKTQLLQTAKAVKEAGARLLRGGAFKPRTSPSSFKGLGMRALKLLAETRDITGLPIITEVMDTKDVEVVAEHADVLQIGARNAQNFRLLEEVGKQPKPVFLKRGPVMTIDELLQAADYILQSGNHDVILCERGVFGPNGETRNVTDINAVPVLKILTHLPVYLDPSHSTGRKDLINPIGRAGIAAGADGLIIEVHPKPDRARSDGAQSVTPSQFIDMMSVFQATAQAIGRSI